MAQLLGSFGIETQNTLNLGEPQDFLNDKNAARAHWMICTGDM